MSASRKEDFVHMDDIVLTLVVAAALSDTSSGRGNNWQQ
jgi:hypothetical protein